MKAGFRMKKLIIALLLLFICSTPTAFAAVQDRELILTDEYAVYKYDASDMIPVGLMSMFTAAETNWNQDGQTILIKYNGNCLEAVIGSKEAVLNGSQIALDKPPTFSNGNVYLPVTILNSVFGGALISCPARKEICISFKPVNSVQTKDACTLTPGESTSPQAISPVADAATAMPQAVQASVSLASSAAVNVAMPEIKLMNAQVFKPVDDSRQGTLLLVNRWKPIPNSFQPLKISCTARSGVPMRTDACAALNYMLQAGNTAGLKGFVVSSGYRAYTRQCQLFFNKISMFKKGMSSADARSKASTIVAIPGTSEHQTGLAADLTTVSLRKRSDPLVADFGQTPEGKWLGANSQKYGFVVRYQQSKSDITGIISEPWHVRYVGLPHAEIMQQNDFCLEEYIAYLQQNKLSTFTLANGKTYKIYYFNKQLPIDKITISSASQGTYSISGDGNGGSIITKAI